MNVKKNWQFYQLLKQRGMTMQRLAHAAGYKSHGHVCETVNNIPGHGGRGTRLKLFPLLQPQEITALGWNAEYNQYRREQRATKSRSTGNNVPLTGAR